MLYILAATVSIISTGAVVGKKERNGPLSETFAPFFDSMSDPEGEDRFGQKTFERAEAEMQRPCHARDCRHRTFPFSSPAIS